MMVDFIVEFNAGIGTANIMLFRGGEQVGDTLIFNESGTMRRDIDPGFYNVTVTGNSPPGGTFLTISQPTTPETPDTITVGPITKAYSLHL